MKTKFIRAVIAGCLVLPASMINLSAISGTIVCPETDAKCKVTREYPDGTREIIDSEKGSDRGAIEIDM